MQRLNQLYLHQRIVGLQRLTPFAHARRHKFLDITKQSFPDSFSCHNMQHYLFKLCILLALTSLSINEWVEIEQSRPQDNRTIAGTTNIYSRAHIKQLAADVAAKIYDESSFTTPTAEWIEYQRERFGMMNSNKLVVSGLEAGGLKHSSQIVVPANVQLIQARTKLVVKSTSMPDLVEVVVTPKVETTSKRDMSHMTADAEGIVETITEATGGEDNNGQLQFPSMKGFLEFLKSMQSDWIKKSALSIEKKIKLLKQLRDNLMKVIEDQFSVLWQPERRRRKKRGLLDESNLEFPPEAALMSINFLTFAVFLIKLVLQVVEIVKSKHYSFSGFNVNTEITRTP